MGPADTEADKAALQQAWTGPVSTASVSNSLLKAHRGAQGRRTGVRSKEEDRPRRGERKSLYLRPPVGAPEGEGPLEGHLHVHTGSTMNTHRFMFPLILFINGKNNCHCL